MSRRTVIHVWVQDGEGGTREVPPGTTAESLGDLAKHITNPRVWDSPEEETPTAPAAPAGADLAPPAPAAPVDPPAMPDSPGVPPAVPDAETPTEPVDPPTPIVAEEAPVDPAEEPEEPAEEADMIPAESEVPTGNMDEVLEWVGEDPERAKVALRVESAKSRPRSTLVAELEDLAADAN